MRDVVADFAGEERVFDLRLGEILDIEAECGLGIGAIYIRLAKQEWRMKEVRSILAHGLRGGGSTLHEAKKLIDERIDAGRWLDLYELALDVLIKHMAGIEAGESEPEGDPERRIDAGEVLAAFARMGIDPARVREIAYDDFVHLARAMGGDDVKPPSREEFRDMVRRYEERHGKVAGAPE